MSDASRDVRHFFIYTAAWITISCRNAEPPRSQRYAEPSRPFAVAASQGMGCPSPVIANGVAGAAFPVIANGARGAPSLSLRTEEQVQWKSRIWNGVKQSPAAWPVISCRNAEPPRSQRYAEPSRPFAVTASQGTGCPSHVIANGGAGAVKG